MTFEEVRKDYLAIMRIDAPYDMTGGYEDATHMEDVILYPTKKNAKKYMINVIRYGFGHRNEYWRTDFEYVHISENEVVNDMYNKYML
jgi:hypothetical protein